MHLPVVSNYLLIIINLRTFSYKSLILHMLCIFVILCIYDFLCTGQYYFLQKMKSCMAEAESLQPVYTKMADSIK